MLSAFCFPFPFEPGRRNPDLHTRMFVFFSGLPFYFFLYSILHALPQAHLTTDIKPSAQVPNCSGSYIKETLAPGQKNTPEVVARRR